MFSFDSITLYSVGFISLLAILYAGIIAKVVRKSPIGTKKMADIAKAIQEGARAYLNRQYRVIFMTVAVIAIILLYAINLQTMLGFILGALFSTACGYFGMNVAVLANVRTAEAARSNTFKALKIAFRSGSIMGMLVVGFGLFAVGLFYGVFNNLDALVGLGFGGSLVALFARVGGGIYTKAADVGADLVGKVEAGIPEDDPRNPAVIADNVGDNVGDVAGMGADLYESYVGSIIAAMILGAVAFSDNSKGVLLPLVVAGVGIVAALLGTFFVRLGKSGNIHMALNKGVFSSAILMIIFSYLISRFYINDLKIFFVIISGLIAGLLIGLTTEYFTSDSRKPAQGIALASRTGAATNIISGMALGMQSTLYPVILVSIAILVSFQLFGLYGIAIAAIGMLSTLGITLATDTYGPVADNAAGIAEMAGLPTEVRSRTESLDAVGNTTAAIGKGFAIGSAALTALALFSVYSETVKLDAINVMSPKVMVGLLLGAMLPFIFSAMTMKAVSDAAYDIVKEVRRQFQEIKGLMAGKARADYKSCVDISTKAAISQMATPALLAVLVPVIVGFFLGAEALGGLLAGSIATGFLMAIFMANAGGAWDNAKKYIEAGNLGGKGSVVHKAAVVGDTVGDPFKDTSGPSINILIKLISIVALLIGPIIIAVDFNLIWMTSVGGGILILLAAYILFGKKLLNEERDDEEDNSKGALKTKRA